MATWLPVRSFRGQFKIQQMVFVLVATIIFFGIVAIFYISIRFDSLHEDVEDQRTEAVLEQVRKISGTPEFIWGSGDDCAACVDMDKIFLLKNRTAYQGFWKDIALLKVSRVYPRYSGDECTPLNYPECNSITLTQKQGFEAYESFVSLCRYDGNGQQRRCDLGKVIIGFEGVEDAR